jgi:hypothetical protein
VPLSGSRTLSDYSFIGDIQSVSDIVLQLGISANTQIIFFQIVHLGRPGLRYLAPEESSHSSLSEGNDLQVVTIIDPCVRPFVHITGVAIERSKTEAMFDINVEQYVSCVKSNPGSTSKGVNRLKPTTFFLCHIPDTAKFKSWGRKPMPGNKRYASVFGTLTGANRSGNDSEVEEFLIDTECVTPCGQYVPLATNRAALGSPSCECAGLAFFDTGA